MSKKYRMRHNDKPYVINDIERLHEECKKLAWDKELGDYRTQTALQSGGDGDFAEGTGTYLGNNEHQWDKLRPDLIGTYWEKFFDEFPWKVYRTRIMIMEPRTCYSMHVDPHQRLHIATYTNKQARFLFVDPPELVEIPANGGVFKVDTRELHTAINCGNEKRWHLLMSLSNDDDN
jgi:hypothetical protein